MDVLTQILREGVPAESESLVLNTDWLSALTVILTMFKLEFYSVKQVRKHRYIRNKANK